MRTLRICLFCLLTAGLTLPAAADYLVVLKNGNRIEAREKYEVRGDTAIVTLLNGTRVSYQLDQIDAAATEEVNSSGFGSAVQIDTFEEPEPPTPEEVDGPKATLSDLINQRSAGLRRLPGSRREARPELETSDVPRTEAGFTDLLSLPRQPYGELEIAGELQKTYRTYQVDSVSIFHGTGGDRPLIEVSTNSEASVFRAVTVSAKALLDAREQYGNRLGGIDLLLITTENQRAGQFRLDSEMADELMSRQIEPAEFFLKYVQF